MANWIPWTKGLELKPEIFRMTRLTGMGCWEVVGRCMRVWCWADDQTIDGFVADVTADDLDAPAGVPGFGKAMLDAGWLKADDRGVFFPNWPRWNTESAKARAQTKERMRKMRNNRVT
jgi:hypothetical protein